MSVVPAGGSEKLICDGNGNCQTESEYQAYLVSPDCYCTYYAKYISKESGREYDRKQYAYTDVRLAKIKSLKEGGVALCSEGKRAQGGAKKTRSDQDRKLHAACKIMRACFRTAFMMLAVNLTVLQSSTGVAGGEPDDIQIAAGRLKADQTCANCHGLYGDAASGGNSAMSPKLTAQTKAYLSNRLKDYKTGRIQHPQMSLIAGMISEKDIDDTSAWYASIEISVLGNPNDLGRKEAGEFCAGCHGLDGQADAGGGTIIPKLTAQPKDYLIIRLRDYRSGQIVHPQMSPIAKALSDRDIENVAAWYSGIEVDIIESD